MGREAGGGFIFRNARSLIGHDEQNQRLSRFRMLDSARRAFIHAWNRGDSVPPLPQNSPAFRAFSEMHPLRPSIHR